MYIPKDFREEDAAILYKLMEEYNFAALVTQTGKGLIATHLPFFIDASRGEHGILTAHMARANPHWQSFDGQQEALVIFQGPHAYITPSWYEPAATNVPTWNMAVVHAYGVPRIIEDHDAMYGLLNRLVNDHEASFETPWAMQSSEDYVHRRIGAIVGFEIPISRLEAKFKLSQNRSEADQGRVIEALSSGKDETSRKVAALMKERHKPDGAST